MAHTLHPNDDIELRQMVDQEIKAHGVACSLNHIDVSRIGTMHRLFAGSDFNGDISQWATRNVRNMDMMFQRSRFNGDVSTWKLDRIESLAGMFQDSLFRGDLREWKLPPGFDPDNAASLVGWIRSRMDSNDHWSSLRLPLWPVASPDLFGGDHLIRHRAMHQWLACTPLCRYHWDALLASPTYAPKEGRVQECHEELWATDGHRDHLLSMGPILQALGLPSIDIAEQLHASFVAAAPSTLPLPTLD